MRPIARARASRQSEMCEQGGNANKTMTCWLKRSGVKGSGNAMWAQPKVGVAALCSRLLHPRLRPCDRRPAHYGRVLTGTPLLDAMHGTGALEEKAWYGDRPAKKEVCARGVWLACA